MADQKISQLNPISTIDTSADLLPIVDSSGNETMKVTPENLANGLNLGTNSDASFAGLTVSDGNVGIGTNSPAYRLEVARGGTGQVVSSVDGATAAVFTSGSSSVSSGAAVTIASGASAFASVFLGDYDDGNQAGLLFNNSTNTLSLRNGDSQRVNLASDGNLLVGTTSNSARLFTLSQAASQPSLRTQNQNASFSGSLSYKVVDRAASTDFNFGLWRSGGSGGDTEFKFSGDGNGTCDGSWTGGGADYAEYFEWLDGNPNAEDRVGYSVVLDGDKIRKAVDGEEPLGVISGNPSVIGDGDMDRWKGKFLRDDFNRYVWEDYEVVSWTEHVPAVTEEQAVPAVLDDNGSEIEPARTEIVEVEPANDIPHSYAADQMPDDVTVPEDAERVTQQRRKLNPTHDDALEYTPRSERAEWDTVGLVGKLRIRKGQPTGSRWIKMRDISETVEEWMVR